MNQKTIPSKSNSSILNLPDGFVYYAVLKINEQVKPSPNIFFAAGQIFSPLKIEIGLLDGDMVLWLTDASGAKFQTTPIAKKFFANKFFLLCAEIIPIPREDSLATETAILQVTVNTKHSSQKRVSANLGVAGPDRIAVGADLDSKHNTAFELTTLAVYSGVHSAEIKDEMAKSFKESYALNYDS